jgi:hypothetical protein
MENLDHLLLPLRTFALLNKVFFSTELNRLQHKLATPPFNASRGDDVALSE